MRALIIYLHLFLERDFFRDRMEKKNTFGPTWFFSLNLQNISSKSHDVRWEQRIFEEEPLFYFRKQNDEKIK